MYADLAFQTSLRSGMWTRKPSTDLIGGWVERALEEAAPGSPARAKALLAQVDQDPEGAEEVAREALEIAAALGKAGLDPSMRARLDEATSLF